MSALLIAWATCLGPLTVALVWLALEVRRLRAGRYPADVEAHIQQAIAASRQRSDTPIHDEVRQWMGVES